MRKKNLSNKLELQKRIRVVQEWILQDYATPDIIAQCIAQWAVTERQAYRYLWAANRFFIERDQRNLDVKIAYYLQRKRKLIRDMKPEERKSAAGVAAINKILDSMAKLEGVSVDTLKVIGDPRQPVVTESKLSYSTPNIDYQNLPTEFLEYLVSTRKAS